MSPSTADMSGSTSWSGVTPISSPARSFSDETRCNSLEIDRKDAILEKGEGVEAVKDIEVVAFPEGGVQATCAVVGATLVLFATFGLSNSFGVFQAFYKNNQLVGYGPSTISWIGSVHLAIVFGTGLLSGVLFDAGYFQYQLLAGSILWVIGTFLLSLSTTYLQIFLSQSICLGLALGLMFSPCLSCVGTYYKRRRSTAIGIVASGAAIGAIMFPILLNSLFASHGFAFPVRAAAYLMAGLLLIANLLMRPRSLPPTARPSTRTLLVKFSTEPAMWLVCCGVFCVMAALFVPMFYIQVFVRSHDFNPTLATYSLPILNVFAFLGRISVGLLADRYGVLNTSIPFAGVMGVMVFAMLGATTTAGTLIFLILFGFSSGGFVSISASCFMSLSLSVSEIGLRSGVGFLFIALASLSGPPLAGFLLTAAEGEYWAPCVFGGTMGCVGCALLGGARVLEGRRKGSKII